MPPKNRGEVGRCSRAATRCAASWQRGAHARIYLAEDLTTGSPVALKILSPETALSPEFRIRLQREGQAMKAISHPNVATVIDAGETEEGVPFLAMEALLGESLGEYVRREADPARYRVDLAASGGSRPVGGTPRGHRASRREARQFLAARPTRRTLRPEGHRLRPGQAVGRR